MFVRKLLKRARRRLANLQKKSSGNFQSIEMWAETGDRYLEGLLGNVMIGGAVVVAERYLAQVGFSWKCAREWNLFVIVSKERVTMILHHSSPRRGRLIQPLYYTSTRVGRHSIRVRFYDDLLRGPSELRFISLFMFPRDEGSLITNSSFAKTWMVVGFIV